jgi:transglutaminase-like putative cysteine protease
MPLSWRLQQWALLLLWGQLLATGQLHPVTAILLPAALVLGLKPAWLPESRRLTALTLLALAAWAGSSPWLERSAWLGNLSNLVWLMAALKLLEARQIRQLQRSSLVILIGVGLAGVASQNLAASLIQGSCALLCVTALVALEAGPQPLAGLLRRCLQLVGLMLPLVLTAFLVLPRLPALWSLPGGGIGQSGISERLNPGDLSQLVQSGGLAARVQFREGPPPPEQRYWRVLVHQRFDGRSWSQARTSAPAGIATTSSGPIDQRWLLEPSPLPWRPWGGRGTPDQASWRVSGQGTLWAGQGLNERQLYSLQSTERPSEWRTIPPTAIDLSFPMGSNPRLEALGQRWRQQSPEPRERVQRAQRWFQSQPFAYSLEPGTLPAAAPLDAFLFERRLGFCEHYAASFAALMRAAGVPARVVVGYQGGRWQQPLAAEPYLLLEQSDAHAWSEVWLPDQGWVEVDPTGWIVPERIRQSLAASLSRADRSRLSAALPSGWLQQLGNQWQGLDTRWQLWVMQFDSQRQQELLPAWLHGQWQGLIGVLTIGLGLAGALLVVLQLDHRTRPTDPVRRKLNRCLEPLKPLQLEPQAGETLQQFCQRAGAAEPWLRPLLERLCKTYNGRRYAPETITPQQALRDLQQLRGQLRLAVRRRTTSA